MNATAAPRLARAGAEGGVEVAVELRLCRATDLARLEWFGAFTHHRAIIREAFALQGRGEALMLLALETGFPVGQAWLDFRPKPGAEAPTVWAVRVMPAFQGAGLGARLMRELERLARRRGVAALEVGVETDNAAARRFYERLGWRLLRERRHGYSYVTPAGQHRNHALHEWVLGKRLACRAVQAARALPTRIETTRVD